MKKLKFVKLFEEQVIKDEKKQFFKELKNSEIFQKNEDGKYIKQEEIKNPLFRHLHGVMATRCKAYGWGKEDILYSLNHCLNEKENKEKMLDYLFDQYEYYKKDPDKLIKNNT